MTEISYQQGLVILGKDVFELLLGSLIHMFLVVGHQGFGEGLPDCINPGHTATTSTGTEMSTLVNCSFPEGVCIAVCALGISRGRPSLDEAGPVCVCPAVAIFCSGRPAGPAQDPGRACARDPPRAALTPGKLTASFSPLAFSLHVCV